MDLSTSTAFVTGANRGLGRHFAEQLVARGATVYAGARDPSSVAVEGAIAVQIDVTDPASIAAAVAATEGVSVLINNAGTFNGASLDDGAEGFQRELDVHFFGPLAVTQAFRPQLAAAGESAVLNVLSALSWFTDPSFAPYAAAKAAGWSLTNAQRLALAEQGTLVTALHVGYMDTDMAAGVDAPKADPADVAALGLDGIAAGAPEVLADDTSRQVQAGLAGGASALYPQFA